MKKADIRVQLGLKMMSVDNTLTAAETTDRLDKFFKGCISIAEMQNRIKLNGGWDKTAAILAATPVRIWRKK